MSQQINLFNPVFLKQKKIFSAVNMLDALALLLVGVFAFYTYASITTLNLDRQAVETARQYDQAKLWLAEAGARYAPKTIDAALEAEVNSLQVQLSARRTSLDNLGIGALAQEAAYAEYMRALARQSLPGLWLTGIKVAKGGAEIEISGRALQPELVPAFIHRLDRERSMHGPAFDSLSMTQGQAALPADPSPPAAAPATYAYTEFRLGTSHGALPAQSTEGPAAALAPEALREIAAGAQREIQSRGAASK